MFRVNVGGKTLTNVLKEAISFRQWDMTEATYLVTLIKERLCYCSLNFWKDLEKTKLRPPHNDIYRDYILPDYVTDDTGRIKEPNQPHTQTQANNNQQQQGQPQQKPQDAQLLKMNNERITIPEILFNPSDVGKSN